MYDLTNVKKSFGGFRHLLMTAALILFACVSAYAQDKTVSGVVIDSNGDPMVGVTIMAKGTTNGTATDIDGKYQLSHVTDNSVLVFSYVGCIAQEIRVGNRTVIDVVMKEDAEVLEDLIVVGYGVQKKSDLTGAITQVDSETLNNRPVSNALEALQGKAAGVDITSNQRPGEIGSVRIRGNRSLSASNEPLYVVDGVPLQSGGIDAINPRDIESIDILKDASATAIYGSRGANGVVIITTKAGKPGRFSLTYNGSVTVSDIVDRSPSMTAAEFINFRRWAAYNLDPETYASPYAPTKENDMLIFDSPLDGQTSRDNVMRGWAGGTWNPDAVIDYDWTDLYTRTGIVQEHTLSASGGSDKMNAYASFGYLDNQGTQKGQWYKRYTGKVTTSITPVKWMQIDASINATWSNQDYGLSGSYARSNSVPNSIYGLAKTFYRFAPMYDADGERILFPGGENATYTIVGELEHQKYLRQNFRALGNFAAMLKFGEMWAPLKGLTYKISIGPDYRHWRSGAWLDGMSSYRIQASGQPGKNFARLENRRYFSWTLDNLINYSNTFAEKHNVGVTLLQTASKYNYEWSSMQGSNVPKDSYTWNNMGSIAVTDTDNAVGIGSGITDTQLESYMIRINYGFDDRYLLTASGRWDGASQLAEGHKWDFFPSLAVAWRMDQEEFMRANWLSNLKLRLGVGVTGNAAVDPYATKGLISQMFLPFNGGSVPAYSSTEGFYNIANPLANQELGWEKTTQWNLGLDFGFLNNRIGGSLEFYWSKTNDLLMQVALPSVTGFASTWANVGKTANHGIEMTINAFPVIANDFIWETNFNAAYQKDKIVELANGKEDDIANRWFIGREIGVFYAYDNLGLWQDTPEDRAEMEKWNANGYKFTPGTIRPKDQNGDYKMDDSDQIVLGNTNPRWTLGWSNTLSWKGIELGFQIIGKFDYLVNVMAQAMTAHANQDKVDYWTPENTGAYYQKPILAQATSGSGDQFSGLLGYRKGGYLMMRNISLGYNFPYELINKATFKTLKVYAQCINPFSFYQAVKGYDLDVNATYYNRSFVFGIELGF